MLIDWFTVVAQMVNFLILIWILKRFLYGPIMRAMQSRRDAVAAEMAEVREARAKAEHRSRELVRERRRLDEAKQHMLDAARQEVAQWKDQSLAEARDEVDHARKQWREGLARERQRDLDLLRNKVAKTVMDVSAKVLDDLADHQLAAHAVDTFLERLERAKADGGDATAFAYNGRVAVRIPSVLEDEARQKLTQSLIKLFGSAKGFDLEPTDDFTFGLRVLAGDRKWDWNLTTYLRELEQEVFGGLSTAAGTSGKTPAAETAG